MEQKSNPFDKFDDSILSLVLEHIGPKVEDDQSEKLLFLL